MSIGLGTGLGLGKGVKGGWRVNAFLLLLTGWQAVLLPWAPLLLKEVGLSATYVGALSGGSTMAASVGVVVCLRAIRRNRSGAMRRLILLILLTTAAVLQGCGVALVLQHLSQGGIMLSCVSGWLFTPMAPLQNNVSIQTTLNSSNVVPSLPPHKLTILATKIHSPTSSPEPSNGSHEVITKANPPLSHHSSLQPASTNFTTTTTTSTSLIATLIPTISPIKTPAIPIPAVTPTRHSTTPVVMTTIKPQYKFPLNSSFSTEGALASGESGGHEGWGKEVSGTGKETGKAPHQSPVYQGNHRTAHKPQPHAPVHDVPQNYHNTKPHLSHEAPKMPKNNNYEESKYHLNHIDNRPQGDEDYLTKQEYFEYDDDDNDDDETLSQEVDNYDSSKDSEKMEDDHLNSNDHRKAGNHFRPFFDKSPQSLDDAFPKVGRTEKFPSIPLKLANFHKSYSQETQNNHENLLGNSHHTDLVSENRNQHRWSSPIQNEKEKPSYNVHQSSRRPNKHLLLKTKAHRLHLPLHAIKDPLNGVRQDGNNELHQIISNYINHRRNRRSLSNIESKSYAEDVQVTKRETETQHQQEFKNTEDYSKLKSSSVQAGVAVLLILSGLAGAGVEAAVTKLWHCIIHGYDESGVSHDVLQRTITHTFHLSTYGNHKTWSGITSGGWVIGAGVLSILTCLAGAGGGGYAGLLGMYLALGMGALLLLLFLPVPYGSIDPPKTRRPLSLYLDDEVLREGVRRLTFHIWVLINGSLVALSLVFSLWLLQEMTAEGWLVSSQAGAVGMTFVFESLALHTQQRLVTRWGLHGLMAMCEMSLVFHYGIMWASQNVGMVVAAHTGLGVAMAFLWVAVKHNALLLATVNDQEREAWASWWCWRLGLSVGAAAWGAGVTGAGEKVQPLLMPATLITISLAASLCITALLSRRNSRAMRRVYHTLDLDIGNDEIDEDDAAEDDWLVRRAKKEGLSL